MERVPGKAFGGVIDFCNSISDLFKQGKTENCSALPTHNSSAVDTRRKGSDRRMSVGGCVSPGRLRKSLWMAFNKSTGLGELQIVEPTEAMIALVYEGLMPVMTGYQFVARNTGICVRSDKALEKAILSTARTREFQYGFISIHFIDSIAQTLSYTFYVYQADRRRSS